MFLLLCPFAELSLIVHIIIYRIFLVRFLRVQDYKKNKINLCKIWQVSKLVIIFVTKK